MWRVFLASDVALVLLTAATTQVRVELVPVSKLRNRCPVVAAEVAHFAFYPTFLVASTRIAELRVESPVRAKRYEALRLVALVTPKDLAKPPTVRLS